MIGIPGIFIHNSSVVLIYRSKQHFLPPATATSVTKINLVVSKNKQVLIQSWSSEQEEVNTEKQKGYTASLSGYFN